MITNFKNFHSEETTYTKISSRLYKKDSTDFYEYMGERNSGIWSDRVSTMLNTHETIDLSEQEMVSIEYVIGDLLSDRQQLSGRVEYPKLKSVVNSRFGNCWFLKESPDAFGSTSTWDICVQKFSDDWFIVNIGSGQGWYNYWYRCDTIDGVLKLIKDKLRGE